MLKPEYTTKEVDRYYFNTHNKKWLIYTDSSFKNLSKINNYPNIKKHLDKFHKVITSDNAPYGLHRSRKEDFFIGEKIISLRKCTKQPRFSYSDTPSYVSATFNVIKPKDINIKYLLSLLNSKMVAFYLKHNGTMQGANYQVDKEPLCRIPLISNAINENQFIKKAQDMLDFNQELNEISSKLFWL